MDPPSIIQTITDIVKDPVKVHIWFEILRKPGITAKELKKKVNVKGNAIYYHLNYLEQEKLVSVQEEPVKDKNFTQKRYSVSEDFCIEKEEKGFEQLARDHPEVVVLFELYLMTSVLNKQIQKVKQLLENKDSFDRQNNFGELFLVSDRAVPELREKYREIREIIKKYTVAGSLQEQARESTHGAVFGCFLLD